MSALQWISDHRWPIGITAILCGSILANAVLLYQATRPDAAVPMPDYYQRSLKWDETNAVKESSRELGWTVRFEVPAGPQYAPAMPRPIDVAVADRDGKPIAGLKGTLSAVRPADGNLDDEGVLVELPQTPGAYRALVRLPADGLWEIDASLEKDGLTYVTSRRLQVVSGSGP